MDMCSFWVFVDIDTLTQFVISSRSMLLLPKYIYCSKITKVIDILAFQSSIIKDSFETEIKQCFKYFLRC